MRLVLSTLLLVSCGASACAIADTLAQDPTLIPAPVWSRFCEPEPGYQSFLLIRAAIREDNPVYRTITVGRDSAGNIGKVRLYQFDKHGDAHPDVWGEPQAVIDFAATPPRFTANVKGRFTVISFGDRNFEFEMGGFFGLSFRQPLDAQGRLSVDGRTTSVLLISASDRDRWQWILDDGTTAPF